MTEVEHDAVILPVHLLEPFAAALLAKRSLLGTSTLSKPQRSAVLSSMSVDIRKVCDLVHPSHLRAQVSEAAMAHADERAIDLTAATWQTQPSFDPGRAVFHLEHVLPVNSVRRLCLEALDLAGIVAALQQVRIAWILKSEDRELSRLGYSSVRPDPDGAYAEAGIRLRQLPQDLGRARVVSAVVDTPTSHVSRPSASRADYDAFFALLGSILADADVSVRAHGTGRSYQLVDGPDLAAHKAAWCVGFTSRKPEFDVPMLMIECKVSEASDDGIAAVSWLRDMLPTFESTWRGPEQLLLVDRPARKNMHRALVVHTPGTAGDPLLHAEQASWALDALLRLQDLVGNA